VSSVKAGDRIEAGPIPATVTALRTIGDDELVRMPDGWWCCSPEDPDSCSRHTDDEMLADAPLTVIRLASARPPAPQVYSIPEQPEGVTRVETYNPQLDRTETWELLDSGPHRGYWRSASSGGLLTWPHLLIEEGSVTVAPREPRTWEALDKAPRDVQQVRGKSGTVYRRFAPYNEHGTLWTADGGDNCHVFSALREDDGPLTEVFEEQP
jgi:hypothetical protein